MTPKILYIAGYGRSGSTILDIILSGHPEITGVGEVTFLLDDWADPGRRCSCGAAYRDCAFWRPLFSDAEPSPETAGLVRKIERRSFIPRLLLGAISGADRQRYRAHQRSVLAHIVSQTGSSIVVDSSKSARGSLGRFVALRRLAEEDVYVLHLVRDGLAVMESELVTGDNWALEGRTRPRRWPAARAAFGWVATNLWVPVLGRLIGPDRYMLLRYEDLIDEPSEALRAAGRFCGFDASGLIERIDRGEHFDVGHMVGGNRVRLEGKLKLKGRTKGKDRSRLRLHERLIFACFGGGWLRRSFGYC